MGGQDVAPDLSDEKDESADPNGLDLRRRQWALGQLEPSEICNRIMAIPVLLDMIAIEATVITADALGGVVQRVHQA